MIHQVNTGGMLREGPVFGTGHTQSSQPAPVSTNTNWFQPGEQGMCIALITKKTVQTQNNWASKSGFSHWEVTSVPVTPGVAEGSPSRGIYTRKLYCKSLPNKLLCASLQKIKQHQCPGLSLVIRIGSSWLYCSFSYSFQGEHSWEMWIRCGFC